MTPENWNKDAHNLWLKEDKEVAIQTLLNDLNNYGHQKPRDLLLQFSYYLFLLNDYATAADVLKNAHNQYPHDGEILQNLVASLSRAKLLDDALIYAQKLLKQEPKNILLHDSLTHIYHRLKQYDNAKETGTNTLKLKDSAYGLLSSSWKLPDEKLSIYTKHKKHVISFSLFGEHPRYLRGALRNLLLAPDLYPNWEIWFWIDDSVPMEFQKLITKLGGIIKKQTLGQNLLQKLSWRFLVSDDESVGYFLVRDADSIISIREVMAVNEWIKSEQYFHIMRDWWTHTDLILAGMWGGVANILPNMKKAISNYQSDTVETPNIDQWFLRDEIWKYIKLDVFIHDRYFNHMPPSHWSSYPIKETEHVGMNEAAISPQRQEKLLEAWIKLYPCLQ